MKNAYIVDFFLSGMLMLMMFFLYIDIINRISELNKVIDRNSLAVAIGHLFVQSILLSVPLIAFLMFLLWRFFAVMLESQVWGYGAAGLLFVTAVLGVVFIWLDMLLISIKASRFVDASKLMAVAKKSKQASLKRLPPSNTPLSEV